MKYLKKYSTEAERQAATAIEPSASIVVEDEGVYYDRAWDTPTEVIHENKSPYWTWDWQFIRPAEWPDLDIVPRTSLATVVLTYDCRDKKASPSTCDDRFFFRAGNASATYTVERGTTINGEFVVNATYSVTNGDILCHPLPIDEGDFVVYRVSVPSGTWQPMFFSDYNTNRDTDGYVNRVNKIVEVYWDSSSYIYELRSHILRHFVWCSDTYAMSPFFSITNTEIEYLDIRNKKVPSLPGSFSQNSMLKEFDFDSIAMQSSVASMYQPFNKAYNMEVCKVTKLDTSATTNFSGFFLGCTALKSIDLSTWDTSKGTNFAGMFQDCISLEELDLSSFSFSLVNTAESIRYMFKGCKRLKNIILNNPDFSGVKSIQEMFYDCHSMDKCPLSGKVIDFSHLIQFGSLFANCFSLLKIDMSYWVLDSTLIQANQNQLFFNCQQLTTIKLPSGFTYVLTGWFYNNYNLKTIIVPAATPPTCTFTSATLTPWNPNYKIYVPDASVDTYKTATGWLNAADHIYGISTYTGD